jgi:HD-like signal output (HDOD) protein
MLTRDERFAGVTRRITRLPVLPRNMRALLSLLELPEVRVEQIDGEIRKDLSLSTEILKIANSGYYGASTPIATTSQAIVLLGFTAVRSIALSATAGALLQRAGFVGLFEHSLGCARAALVLGKVLAVPQAEELYTAGLLHDVGKVILVAHLPAEYATVSSLLTTERLVFAEAEERVLGFNHAELGGWFLGRWELPDTIVRPVAEHHRFDPTSAHAHHCAVLHLADVLIRAEGVGWAGDALVPAVDPAALQLLQLDVPDIEPLMNAVMEQVHDIPRFLE